MPQNGESEDQEFEGGIIYIRKNQQMKGSKHRRQCKVPQQHHKEVPQRSGYKMAQREDDWWQSAVGENMKSLGVHRVREISFMQMTFKEESRW